MQLLPEEHRAAVEGALRGGWPRTRREAMLRGVAHATARLMGTRTKEIDEGLAELPPGYQLVIVGAGLDSRAHRLPALKESVVFELDHPASQAFKRERVAGLPVLAKELCYVSTDLSKEALGAALERAGHSASTPSAWVFEGVITYLSPGEVSHAIEAMSARSAPSSRLLATYNEPNFTRRFAAGFMARAAEPARAAFEPEQMHALLRQHRFVVRSDRGGIERAIRAGMEPVLLDRVFTRFHHVVIADFRSV
jgi:methyltransferase (TIGR00027 family)